MKEELVLIFNREPVPKQSVRVRAIAYNEKSTGKAKAFIQTYQTAKIKDFERNIAVEAREQLPRGFSLMTGPLCVSVVLQFKPPKSLAKSLLDRIYAGATVYKSTRPDLTDNLLKGIFDALEGIVYAQDGQIALIENTCKMYNDVPKIIVKIKEIPDTTDPLFI